jgi:hypothetical protein
MMRNQDVETMWAAVRALSLGSEPPERLVEFLTMIQPILKSFIERESPRLSDNDKIMLLGIRLLLITLTNATMQNGSGRMKLTISPRGRGHPIKPFQEQRARECLLEKAASIVERELENHPDTSVEDALTDAEEATGVSRSEIKKYRRRLRELRDPARIIAGLDALASQIGE